jgi:putative hydrolase of the HAD superfamily
MDTDHPRDGFRWVILDLEDTLYDFRQASRAATAAALRELAATAGMGRELPRQLYADILVGSRSRASLHGLSDREHRAQRFRKLLIALEIMPKGSTVERMLNIHDSELAATMRLNPGALETIRILRAQGRKVMILSEQATDAGRSTVSRLGLAEEADSVLISGEVGTSKTDALWRAALSRTGADPREVIVVGDSLRRDVYPSIAEGMFAVWFCEQCDEEREHPLAPVPIISHLKDLLRFLQSVGA